MSAAAAAPISQTPPPSGHVFVPEEHSQDARIMEVYLVGWLKLVRLYAQCGSTENWLCLVQLSHTDLEIPPHCPCKAIVLEVVGRVKVIATQTFIRYDSQLSVKAAEALRILLPNEDATPEPHESLGSPLTLSPTPISFSSGPYVIKPIALFP